MFLNNQAMLKDFAYISPTCVFTHTKKGEERRINPFQVIEKQEYEQLNKGILDIIPIIKSKEDEIQKIIDAIPFTFEGITIITEVQKTYYKKLLKLRLDDVLIPSYKKLKAEKS